MRNEALSHLSRFSNNNIDSHDIDEKAFPPSPCAFSAFMKSVREKRHMSRLASQLQLSAAQTVLRRPLRMLWVWLRGRIYRCLSQPQQQKTTIIRRVYLCWCFCLFFFASSFCAHGFANIWVVRAIQFFLIGRVLIITYRSTKRISIIIHANFPENPPFACCELVL